MAAEIFGRHGKHAAEQVAEVVGKVGIDAAYKGIFAKAGVRTKVHFAQQKIAEGVRPETLGHVARFHNIAKRF